MKYINSTHEKARNKIRHFYDKKRRMPTFRELGALVGYRSTNAVSKLITKLEQDGVLRKDERGRLIPHNLGGELKVLGLVTAGFPSAAEEELLDTMSLDEWLIENKEASFVLRVSGESMKDAGIREGDMAIVERGRTPKNWDIVIAEIDGEWTMKYYRTTRASTWLQPANTDFASIYPEEELKVAAVVVGLVRKY